MPIFGPPAAAGGSGNPGDLTTDYDTTQPTTPTTGVRLFSRWRARRMLAFVGPTGLDTSVQPAIFANRIARINAIAGTATPSFDGIAVTNAVSGPTSQTPAPGTSFYGGMVRARYSTSTTASTANGPRSSAGQWFFSSSANLGGFFFVCRFGIAVASATQTRWFVGLSTTTAALSATTETTALTNLVGFGANAADTNMRFLTNDGTGTATSVDLGATFPAKTAATYFYEVRLFSASGSGQTLYWSAQRINDGASTQGGPVTTDLPAVNTIMAAHVNISNGTQAAAASIDLQSLYIETDN